MHLYETPEMQLSCTNSTMRIYTILRKRFIVEAEVSVCIQDVHL